MGTIIKIRIPKDVDVIIDGGQDPQGNDVEVTRPFRFVKDFVVRAVLNDKRWLQDTDWTYAGMEIRGLFQTVKAGDIVKLTTDQYKKFKECVEKPTGGWTFVPQVMYQLETFLDALLNPVKDDEPLTTEPPAEQAAS